MAGFLDWVFVRKELGCDLVICRARLYEVRTNIKMAQVVDKAWFVVVFSIEGRGNVTFAPHRAEGDQPFFRIAPALNTREPERHTAHGGLVGLS